MKVEQIPMGNRKVYLLIDSNGMPVEPVAKFMKYHYNQESSSNTLQTYCIALKYYFIYLEQIGIDYQQVSFQTLSDFVAWLRNPYESNKVIPQKNEKAKRSKRTVNTYISAVSSFCVFRNIRTANPETSGHETGSIRTLCRLN